MYHLWLLFLYGASQTADRSLQIFHLVHPAPLNVEHAAVGNAIDVILFGQGQAFQFRFKVIGKSRAGVGTDIPAGMLDANGQSMRTRGIAYRGVWQAECQHIEHAALDDRQAAGRCRFGCPGGQLCPAASLVNKLPVAIADRFLHGFKPVDELICPLQQGGVVVYTCGTPYGGRHRVVLQRDVCHSAGISDVAVSKGRTRRLQLAERHKLQRAAGNLLFQQCFKSRDPTCFHCAIELFVEQRFFFCRHRVPANWKRNHVEIRGLGGSLVRLWRVEFDSWLHRRTDCRLADVEGRGLGGTLVRLRGLEFDNWLHLHTSPIDCRLGGVVSYACI